MMAPVEDIELELLLDGIYRVYHYDFRSYASSSLLRRIQTALVQFRVDSISRLQERVLREPALFTELLRFLTVQVSDLFRDPVYWQAFRELAIPHLKTYAALKMWIAGCATGEEAYSLAIMLHEHGLLERTQIYATDINPEALRTAQDGVYDTARFQQFSENYLAAGGMRSLADYYTAAYGGAVMNRELKKSIVFCDHSLATDSVFAEVHFVSCRNVLIYFDRPLQDRTVGLLADALVRKGFLGLGLKETLRFTSQAGAFTECAPDTRLYRKHI